MASILVVDDAATSREIMGRVLSGLGHMVAFATDGVDALPKAKECKPDLVLMDIVMPQMDGFKAMRTLREDPSTSKIPVVLVSTKNADSDIFWGKKQGAADYLPKPFTEQSLISIVYKILGLSPPSGRASAPAQSMPTPGGVAQPMPGALDVIQKAFFRAMGPFGKVAFKRELDNLGIPPEMLGRTQLSALCRALSNSISDASARSEFESSTRAFH
ncbi:MAG: PleD family two-component system response regulator [Kofleriaceae bacterium]